MLGRGRETVNANGVEFTPGPAVLDSVSAGSTLGSAITDATNGARRMGV